MPANAPKKNTLESITAQQSGDEYLRQPAAAKFIGLSESWLEKDRVTGRSGLKFYRIPGGRAIVYRKSDLIAFINRGVRSSTSEEAA
ncbi:MAG: DNA-binding protein [Alphaproteobacteria bacterium]|nr:DNA-binding protein [Alphaproteobacteria bacterium]